MILLWLAWHQSQRRKPNMAELDQNFGLIRYPNIIHTDNVKEFAPTILQLLKDVKHSIITVTGRPHTLCDQGSKCMNEVVKHVWAMIEFEVMMSRIEPAWRYNCRNQIPKGHRKYAETGYKAACGQIYHHQLNCSIMEVCERTKIEESLLVQWPQIGGSKKGAIFPLGGRFGDWWYLRWSWWILRQFWG